MKTLPGPVWALGLALVVSLGGCRAMSQSHNYGGVSSYQQGNYPSALANFQQAVTTDPTNPDAYYNLASAYHQLAKQTGDQNAWLQAEQLYNRALDHSQYNHECEVASHRALAVLLVETNRTDKAFTLLKGWANRNPSLAAARVELARLHEEQGDQKTATTYLSQALHINPHDPRALAALGRMREQSGDYAQAVENYRRAYQLNPLQPGVAQRLAALQSQAPPANSAAVPTTTPGLPGYSLPAGTQIATPRTVTPRY